MESLENKVEARHLRLAYAREKPASGEKKGGRGRKPDTRAKWQEGAKMKSGPRQGHKSRKIPLQGKKRSQQTQGKEMIARYAVSQERMHRQKGLSGPPNGEEEKPKYSQQLRSKTTAG